MRSEECLRSVAEKRAKSEGESEMIHTDKIYAEKISMVVLAGGASSRMGRDKCDLMIGDQTFLETQIDKGCQLGIRDILISGYHGAKQYDYPVILDRVKGKGPLGGLESCFRMAEQKQCLVLGVDVPLVPVEELFALIKQAQNTEAKAVILKHGDWEEPLIGVYHTETADQMLEEITQRKGSVFAFLRKIGYECYESSAPDFYFSNINRPEIYEKIRAVE